MVSNLYVHAFGACSFWVHLRTAACVALGLHANTRSWDVMYRILTADPASIAYVACLRYMDTVVLAAEAYRYK